MAFDKVVPAFPYEGALYWLFSGSGTRSYQGSHEYYKSLYGADHDKIVSRASALVCLFDEIVMTPADAALPQDRGLRVSLGGEYLEWKPEVRSLAEELLRNSPVQALVARAPEFGDDHTRFHFVCRTVAQLATAAKNGAVLVGNGFFASVCNEVAKGIGRIGNTPGSPVWTLNPDVLEITGLAFDSANMDAFAAVRHNKAITEYAVEFRKAISEAATAADLKSQLLNSMKKALEQENVAHNVSGVFQTVGSAANFAGLIPVIGSVASGVGIAADAAGRGMTKRETGKQWYMIGPKMREVALKEFLEKL
jgi:hypothetical protein